MKAKIIFNNKLGYRCTKHGDIKRINGYIGIIDFDELYHKIPIIDVIEIEKLLD